MAGTDIDRGERGVAGKKSCFILPVREFFMVVIGGSKNTDLGTKTPIAIRYRIVPE